MRAAVRRARDTAAGPPSARSGPLPLVLGDQLREDLLGGRHRVRLRLDTAGGGRERRLLGQPGRLRRQLGRVDVGPRQADSGSGVDPCCRVVERVRATRYEQLRQAVPVSRHRMGCGLSVRCDVVAPGPGARTR